MNSFETIGFLASDIDKQAASSQQRLAEQRLEIEQITTDLFSEINNRTRHDLPYLVGLLFLLRSIECAQASVILAEYGMATAPAASLRTAFECLFYACAIWRDETILPLLEGTHDSERIKQAQTMLRAGAEAHFLNEQLKILREVAAESTSNAKLSVWDAADRAGFTLDYETAYRGLGFFGAHATLRSLDPYILEEDGTLSPVFTPNFSRTKWVLELVASCLRGGLIRHREALSNHHPENET